MNSTQLRGDPASYENSTVALVAIIEDLINSEVNTCELVKVLKVDKNKNEVNVVPLAKNVDTENNAIEETPVYNIKYFGWQFGNSAIEGTPKENDVGIMVVSKRDISQAKSGVVGSKRKFNMADGIYIGGVVGFNQTPTEYIKFDEEGITIKSTKDVKVEAVNAEINASAVAKVNAPSIELGEGAVDGVARLGDTVLVAGVTGTITSASAIVKAI